jgi:hypothetical protein
LAQVIQIMDVQNDQPGDSVTTKMAVKIAPQQHQLVRRKTVRAAKRELRARNQNWTVLAALVTFGPPLERAGQPTAADIRVEEHTAAVSSNAKT